MNGFPFLGIGGLTAIAVLVVGCAAFAILLRLMHATASGAMIVVPSIVTGFRAWTRDDDGEPEASGAPAPSVPWEDLPPGMAIEDQVGAE